MVQKSNEQLKGEQRPCFEVGWDNMQFKAWRRQILPSGKVDPRLEYCKELIVPSGRSGTDCIQALFQGPDGEQLEDIPTVSVDDLRAFQANKPVQKAKFDMIEQNIT